MHAGSCATTQNEKIIAPALTLKRADVQQCTLKIYTKTGDDGSTGLQKGGRVSKSDKRVMAYGSIDEINSILGVAATYEMDDDLAGIITHLQRDLLTAGADLSNPEMSDRSNRVTGQMVERLESEIDILEGELRPLSMFILPGGSRVAALVHLARTVTRRAETQVAALDRDSINKESATYLNRLSDLLFVLARVLNARKGVPDMTWSADADD